MKRKSAAKMRVVLEWWRGRILDGCQLSKIDNFVEGYDFKICPTRWKNKVTTDAMFKDCQSSVHWIEMTKDEFIGYLMPFMGSTARTTVGRGRLNRVEGDGFDQKNIFMRKRQRFIVFASHEEHKRHLDAML